MSDRLAGEGLKVSFKDFIALDSFMTPDQAISRLAEFQGYTDQAVKDSFFNLREGNAVSVQFRLSRGTRNLNDVVIIAGFDKDSKEIWFERIDDHSGQPVAHTA